MTPERPRYMDRAIVVLAQTELAVNCMTQAATETPGVTLRILGNETDYQRAVAATLFGAYGEQFDFRFENWRQRADKVQQAGGHVVCLFVDGRGLPNGPDPKPFYDRVQQLKDEASKR